MFLRHAWYVAALSSELSEQPLARTILGEHVAMYRDSTGRVVALADTCPHRGYPLSLGRLVDDQLVCGYHGFTFDCDGVCVSVPGQDRIPSKLAVRTYPLVEQGAWVWIWMSREEPDYARLPETPWLIDGEEWSVVTGAAKIDAHVGLLVDNLLDLSHETFLHQGSIGTPEVATTPIEVESDEEAKVVNVYRHMSDVECPPFYANTTGLRGRIDRWQDIEYFAPSFYKLNSRVAPVGQPPLPDGRDDHAFHMKIFYGLTPSTETSVWDFWALSRDFALGDAEVSNFLEKMQANVVQEDVDALNVLQRRANDGQEITEVSIKIDRGGLSARRMLMSLEEDEVARELAKK
ncbi:MAG: aromatic ring-hydroxylating dioxygenase subunit alpha [Acidobacteriota bacterium]|nr:aromatic ring-hydroxylating dioxygenase subunit alpha [Acidobacteriota bacterium]